MLYYVYKAGAPHTVNVSRLGGTGLEKTMGNKKFGSITNIEAVKSINNQIDALSKLTANPHKINELDSKMLEGTIKSDSVPQVHKRTFPAIDRAIVFVKRYILAKVSRKFNSLVEMSDSLESLASINKNVDELMKIRAPYREASQNYEILTEYLYKANKIHSQISKSMKR